MAENEKTTKVIHGDRELFEAHKANEILEALLVEKDREKAFKIAECLTPRGELKLISKS